MTGIASLLLTNFAVAFALFVVLWAVGIMRRDPSHVDAFWAFGMVLLAWTTFFQLGEPTPRRLLLVGLCTACGRGGRDQQRRSAPPGACALAAICCGASPSTAPTRATSR